MQFILLCFIYVSTIFPASSLPREYNSRILNQASSSNNASSTCVYPPSPLSNNSTVILLGNCNNNLYYIIGELGSANQSIEFQIDTGNQQLWVPFVLSNETGGFNLSGTNTAVVSNVTADIVYSSNEIVGGYLGQEYIRFENTNISSFENMLFVMNQTGVSFPGSVEGSVSLAYTGTSNFIDLAYQNKQIKTQVYSLDLNSISQNSYLYYNNYSISNAPNIPANSTLDWVLQTGQSKYWQTTVLSMSINSVQQLDESLSPQYAIFNTGSESIILEQNLFNYIQQKYFSFQYCFLSQSGMPSCPCALLSSWPEISLMMLGAEVYLSPSSYKVPIASSGGLCSANFLSATSSQLISDTIILGLPFFRAYTVSFDKLNSKVGFYGSTKTVYITDGGQGHFLLSQYILIGMMLGLAVIGFMVGCCQLAKVNRMNRMTKMTKKQSGQFQEGSKINYSQNANQRDGIFKNNQINGINQAYETNAINAINAVNEINMINEVNDIHEINETNQLRDSHRKILQTPEIKQAPAQEQEQKQEKERKIESPSKQARLKSNRYSISRINQNSKQVKARSNIELSYDIGANRQRVSHFV